MARREPTRITIIARRKGHLYGQDASNSIAFAMSTLHISDAGAKFLVREDWGRFAVLVFDVYHTAYNPSTAHIPANLPVVVIDVGKDTLRITHASPMMRSDVNNSVAEHHNLSGWDSRPPFIVDQTSGTPPTYDNPRNLSLLRCEQGRDRSYSGPPVE